jgi:hypothetical protein
MFLDRVRVAEPGHISRRTQVQVFAPGLFRQPEIALAIEPRSWSTGPAKKYAGYH